jgi:hypothetical protein
VLHAEEEMIEGRPQPAQSSSDSGVRGPPSGHTCTTLRPGRATGTLIHG